MKSVTLPLLDLVSDCWFLISDFWSLLRAFQCASMSFKLRKVSSYFFFVRYFSFLGIVNCQLSMVNFRFRICEFRVFDNWLTTEEADGEKKRPSDSGNKYKGNRLWLWLKKVSSTVRSRVNGCRRELEKRVICDVLCPWHAISFRPIVAFLSVVSCSQNHRPLKCIQSIKSINLAFQLDPWLN